MVSPTAALFAFIPLTLGADVETTPPELSLNGVPYERAETRANTFRTSTQDQTAIAWQHGGGAVVVWQSRRQQEGSYGIYARRLDRRGRPIGAEVEVNAHTIGMQQRPTVAVDDQGGVWFAWQSLDAAGASVAARRFDAQLDEATAEVRVALDEHVTAGDVALAALTDGAALLVWNSVEADGITATLTGRVISAQGELDARPFAFGDDDQAGARTPALTSDGSGGAWLAWASTDEHSLPSGLHLTHFDPSDLGESDKLDDEARVWRIDGDEGAAGIEPGIAALEGGRLAAVWLEPTDNDYEVRWRTLDYERGELQLGEIRALDIDGPGYTSGVAIALDPEGRPLLSWSRYADGPEQRAGLFAQMFQPSGAPLSEPFRVTEHSEGAQALAAARATPRVLADSHGRLLFGWSGDAQLGDSSGAHVTLWSPAGLDQHELQTAQLDPIVFEEAEAGPHEPPTFDPNRVATRIDDMQKSSGTDFDFLGISNTGWTPPDPHMAVGPNELVVMTNGAIAFFDKDGTFLFQDQIEGSGGFWGSEGATSFVFDPEAIYDPHSGRFVVFATERAGSVSFYLFAVSDDSDPEGTWFKYRINATDLVNDTDIDSGNVTVDEDAIYLTSDFFGPDKFHVMAIDKTSVLNGGTPVFKSLVISGQQSFGMPVTYDTNVPAQYMVGFFFSGSSVRLWALEDSLGTPTTTSIDVTVPTYSFPEDPPQQGTSVRPETFEARFWSAVYRNGSLWATHHVNNSRIRQRWYEFAMNGWPTSGNTPTLVQSGEVDLGGTVRTYFGSLWVDDQNNMALTYSRSSPTEFISMARSWRAFDDPLGTLQPSVIVRPSTNADTSGRWGDYSATSDDPTSPNTFWGFHEYTQGSWRTRVARWEIVTCDGPTTYCTAKSGACGLPAMSSIGEPNTTASSGFFVFASPARGNRSGLLLYSDAGRAAIPFQGGTLCVAPQPLLRSVPVNSGGTAGQCDGEFLIDMNAFAAGALGGNPAAFLTVPGTLVNAQWWGRDTVQTGSFLSDGLEYTLCE